MPLQGPAGRLRSARTARRQEPPLPQPAATARFADVSTRIRHHPRARHLRPRRQHARLRRRRVDRSLCRQRLESRARCIATIATAPSPTSASPPAAPTARTASRRPAWASPIGDYNRDGRMDIFKTNFAGDTSTLYANTGNGLCEDRTFASGFGRNTRWLGWGVAFLDLDLDGWQDLFLVNGHVYPEVEQLKTRGRLQPAQGRVSQPRRRPLRRRDRTARTAGDGPEGRPRRGICRLRQRRRRRRARQQRARHAGAVSPRSARAAQLVGAAAGRRPRRTAAPSARGSRSPPAASRR